MPERLRLNSDRRARGVRQLNGLRRSDTACSVDASFLPPASDDERLREELGRGGRVKNFSDASRSTLPSRNLWMASIRQPPFRSRLVTPTSVERARARVRARAPLTSVDLPITNSAFYRGPLVPFCTAARGANGTAEGNLHGNANRGCRRTLRGSEFVMDV